MKKSWIWNDSAISLAKKSYQTVQQHSSVSIIKDNKSIIDNYNTIFARLTKSWANIRKIWTTEISQMFAKLKNLDISVE